METAVTRAAHTHPLSTLSIWPPGGNTIARPSRFALLWRLALTHIQVAELLAHIH